jgi:hypothetical protein
LLALWRRIAPLDELVLAPVASGYYLIIVGAMVHACCQRAPSTARWRLPFCGEKETPEPAPPATNILPSVKSLMLK